MFAITCFLVLEIFQTRKPIVEIRNILPNISLYNERPQEYYHEFRRKENRRLFSQLKSQIERQFEPLGTKSLNWQVFTDGDKEYVPQRFINQPEIDSEKTVGELIEILNEQKLI